MKSFKKKLNISLIPFNISVDDEEFIDNENLDTKELIKAMKNSPNPVKTSCPSPGDFFGKI